MKGGECPGEKDAAECMERDPTWHGGVSKRRLRGTNDRHSSVLKEKWGGDQDEDQPPAEYVEAFVPLGGKRLVGGDLSQKTLP